MQVTQRGLWTQCVEAAGYSAVLIAPLLLALSSWLNQAYLTVGTVMLVFPLLRVVFGAVPPGDAPIWHEWISAALDELSFGYATALAIGTTALLVRLNQHASSVANIFGWTFSLWVTLLFATCVAHDLLHRRSRGGRLLGHVLAGVSGYPLLGYEHSRHHNLPGNTAAAEWPREDESVWRFSLRRLIAIGPETLGPRGGLLVGDYRSPTVQGLRLAVLTTGITFVSFGSAAGWLAATIYGACCVLVTFSIQLVTYMQHWGLGDDNCSDAKARGFGWESDCRFQAWVTMGLSLHYTHHQRGDLPYYRIHLASDSPRLPMGYVLLMFVAFVPPLWRTLMTPVLRYWQLQPSSPLAGGRRLSCAAFYK